MAILLKRLTGSQGAGIGIGGTFFILFFGIGIWFAIHQTKKARLLKKTLSASYLSEATPSPPDKDSTTTATITNTTDPRYNASSALEMGTAEGNTHQLSTLDNAHELDSPDRLHEMGDLAPEYGAEGDTHVEGDVGADNGAAEGDIYPHGDHGKYAGGDDDKAGTISGERERRGSVKGIAELEGDVAFPDRRAQVQGRGGAEGEARQQEEGREGVGKGFVLTE
jgi:hypothetical protein